MNTNVSSMPWAVKIVKCEMKEPGLGTERKGTLLKIRCGESLASKDVQTEPAWTERVGGLTGRGSE